MSSRSNTQGQLSKRRHEKLYARLGLTSGASRGEVDRAREEIVSFLERAPEGAGRWARNEARAVNAAHARLTTPASAMSEGRARLRRLAVGVATLAITVGVVIGVYKLGGGGEEEAVSGQPAAQAQGLSSADRAQIGELMKKLKDNPKDVPTLVALGNIYFEAGEYNGAGSFMEQAVLAEPSNVKARLALGAALFNLGDSADAERHWQRVVDTDPENVEALYDLGFLYLSENPPEMDKAKEMWGKVIEIAPDSDVAKTVSTHLKGLEKSAPEEE